MAAIALGIAMAVLDGTMISVALPLIGERLAIGKVETVWIVNAYQIAIVATLLPSAALADRFGYRRIYVGGLALFSIASLACALSFGLAGLITARIVQGMAAAAMSSTATALVRFTYPATRLGRGMAFNGMVVALSSLAGPSLASLILEIADWPSLFAINLPIGLAALLMSPYLPTAGNGTVETGPPDHFDWMACLFSALAFGLFFLAVEALSHRRSVEFSFMLTISGIAATMLYRRDRQRSRPLLPLDLLKRSSFLVATMISACAYAAQMAALVCLPFLLAATGRSPAETGILLTCWPLALALIAPLSGRLSDSVQQTSVTAGGLLLLSAGLTFLAAGGHLASDWQLAAALFACGSGFVLFQTPNNHALMLSAPPERSGAASGMLGLARVFGQTSGASMVAIAFSWSVEGGATAALTAAAITAALAGLIGLSRRAVSGAAGD